GPGGGGARAAAGALLVPNRDGAAPGRGTHLRRLPAHAGPDLDGIRLDPERHGRVRAPGGPGGVGRPLRDRAQPLPGGLSPSAAARRPDAAVAAPLRPGRVLPDPAYPPDPPRPDQLGRGQVLHSDIRPPEVRAASREM